MKKMLAICIILLLFGTSLMPTIDSKTTDSKEIKTFSGDESEESFIYIEASSPYDYGLKVGKQFRSQYKLLNILAGSTKKNNFNEIDINDQIKTIEDYCPSYLEELRGLSDGLNIKLERLLFLQNLWSRLDLGGCTATLSTGNATKNNETFLTLNVDGNLGQIPGILMFSMLHLITYKLHIVRINKMNYRYAFFGMPIIMEYLLINEKGLAWTGPGIALTKNESRCIDEGPGMATYMIDRLCMMTCKNVSEVARLYENTERASGTYSKWPHHWDNSVSGWCDREGGILMIEQTHNHIITVFGNSTDITGAREGILWHANHHQWLDPTLTGSMFPSEYPSSALRAERARELLEENYGNITLEVCKEITRDHGGGFDPNGKDPGDICRHPYRDNPRITAFAFIIQPKEMTVYWTHRSPCRSIFWKHDFSRIFGE